MRRRTPDFLAELLTKPENAHYVLTIKTALTWGNSPMQLLVPEYKREALRDRLDFEAIEMADIKLKQAWQILKDESCPSCGMPIWLGYSTNRDVGFRVESTYCYSCAEVADYKKQHKDEDEPGRNFYTVPYTYTGSPLPTRSAFLESVRGKSSG